MIHQIKVKNFKSLNDVTFALERRNILIGANMAGKSNVISLFRFLRHMVLTAPGTYGLQSAITAQGGFTQLAWRGSDSDLLTISLSGDLGPEIPTQTWEYQIDVIGDRQRGYITIQDETLTLSDTEKRVPLIRKDSGSGQRVLADPVKGVVSHLPSGDRSALEFEVPDWQGNGVRKLFASVLFYKLIPATMKQINHVSAPDRLAEDGSNLSSWLMLLQTRHQEEFQRISQAVSDVLPDVARLFTWPTPQGTVFLASHERFLRSPIGVAEMSDGELCFIALLSLIFSPAEYGAPLFCIEEPENYLHPKLIQALVDLLNQRQREFGNRAAQMIITTHSPQLLDALDLTDIVVVEKRNGATQLSRPKDKPHLSQLLASEELGLGDLFFSGVLADK